MDEKKINNEIIEENAPVTEGENADAENAIDAEQVNNAEQSEAEQAEEARKLKKKKRRKVRRIIALALILYAAVILFRQYVYIPGKYEAPPTPVPTDPGISWEVTETPEPTPYVKKIPVKMYFTAREVSFPVERVGIVPYTDADGNQVVNELTIGAAQAE